MSRLYFSRDEILMGRDKQFPLTQEMEDNLCKLIIAISKVREAYGSPLVISSGYRPGHFNTSAGGAKKSAHQSCQAVDISDPHGYFGNFCLNNLTLLEECGIYLEDVRFTPTWTHLQIRPTKSGKRVFIP